MKGPPKFLGGYEIERSESQSRFALALLEGTSDAIVGVTTDQEIFIFNPAAEQIFGYSSSEILGQPLDLLIAPKSAAGHRNQVQGFLEGDESARYMADRGEVFGRRKNGDTFPAAASIMRLELPEGTYLVATVSDLSSARETERRLSSALDQSEDMVWIADAQGRLVYANAALDRVSGGRASASLGRPVLEVFRYLGADTAYLDRLARLFQDGNGYHGVHSLQAADGRRMHVDDTISIVDDGNGNPAFSVSVGRDISERLELQDRLRQLAYYDQLTKLPNRFLFQEYLGRAIERAERTGKGVAVLFIDLDGFKQVNDTYGHAAGDAVLHEIARLLASTIRQQDTLARLGGDEFLLLMEDIPLSHNGQPELLHDAAQRILRVLEQPVHAQGQFFQLNASTGISLYPTDATHSEDLVRHADLAMYQAKETPGSECQFASAALAARASERVRIEQALRSDLEVQPSWAVAYQPIVDLRDGRPRYVEALARWHHSDEGVIGPGQFIPVAEQTGLIKPLGIRVLNAACWQLAEWRAHGVPVERVAVNVSVKQFGDGLFAEAVRRILAETALPPESLELEITETTSADACPVDLGALARLGVRIAIDDFGTGFSTLASVKKLPARALKVDRTFIRDLPASGDSAAIVHATLALAESFGYEVVAEGIETEAEFQILAQWGCSFGQGYWFNRPIWADAIPEAFEIRQPALT